MIRVGLAIAGAAILGALAACIGVPPRPQEAPVEPRTAAPAHSTARWVAAAWSDLPGFAADRATELLAGAAGRLCASGRRLGTNLRPGAA